MDCADVRSIIDKIEAGDITLRKVRDDNYCGTVRYTTLDGLEIDVFKDGGDFDYIESVRRGNDTWESFSCSESTCPCWTKNPPGDPGFCSTSIYRPDDEDQDGVWLWSQKIE